MKGLNQLCFTGMTLSEPMLFSGEQFVFVHMFHDLGVYYVFQDFTAHRSKRYWSIIIAGFGTVTFYVDRRNVSIFPVFGHLGSSPESSEI